MSCTSCGGVIGAKLLALRPTAVICSKCLIGRLWFGPDARRDVSPDDIARLAEHAHLLVPHITIVCQHIVAKTDEGPVLEAMRAGLTPAGVDAWDGFWDTISLSDASAEAALEYLSEITTDGPQPDRIA